MSEPLVYLKNIPPLPRKGRDAILHQEGLCLLCQGLTERYGLTYTPENLDYRDEKNLSESSPIARGPHGKPYLAEHSKIHFNLSNSPNLVVCAFSSSPIGVDIELPREITPALLKRALTAEELSYFPRKSKQTSVLSCVPSENKQSQELFVRLWTCKEALAKCTGLGLGQAIYQVSFSDPRQRLRPLIFQGQTYHLYQEKLATGQIITFCSPQPIQCIRYQKKPEPPRL